MRGLLANGIWFVETFLVVIVNISGTFLFYYYSFNGAIPERISGE